MAREVGYARVSTKEQNLARQIEALKQYVPEEMIVVDKESGKDLNRDGYKSLKVGLGKLVKGDTLYVMSIDRLSRNKEDIKGELEYFRKAGVRVKILNLPTTMIDVDAGQDWVMDMVSNILIEVYSSIAEQERLTIKQRQAEGIRSMPVDALSGKRISARTGNVVGRPKATFPQNWEEVYRAWKILNTPHGTLWSF